METGVGVSYVMSTRQMEQGHLQFERQSMWKMAVCGEINGPLSLWIQSTGLQLMTYSEPILEHLYDASTSSLSLFVFI